MNKGLRRALGSGALLLYLGLYVALAAGLGAQLAPALPTWAQLCFFAVAGVAWVFPLRPLFRWMNGGS